MFECYNESVCANQCICCIKERHLKNYRRSIKDERGLLQNKFFIFGHDGNKTSFLNFFDFRTKRLIDLKISATLLNYSGVAHIDPNRIFICGGVNHQMNNVVATAKIYNISEERFTNMGNMHSIRFNFSILHYENRVYVTGGRSYGANDVAIMNQCEYYDFAHKKWVQMAPMNVQRCGHQMFAYNGKIYVIGGLSLDRRARFLEEYNILENKWRITKKSLIFDLYNFEIFSHDVDELLIVGGLHTKGHSSFIHCLNMKENRISTKGFLRHPRSSFKLFYERTKQRLILLGGAVTNTSQNISQGYMEIFDLINQTSTSHSVDNSLVMKFINRYNYNKPSIILQHSPSRKRSSRKNL